VNSFSQVFVFVRQVRSSPVSRVGSKTDRKKTKKKDRKIEKKKDRKRQKIDTL
jgi:hypothetical protein